jgi:SAM-dependent methyltransferase
VIALRERSRAPELMDTEPVDLVTFEACLKDLERINRWTGAYRITLGWLERLRRIHGVRRLSLVDIGSGYGDMLRRIAAWGEARGIALDLTGVDLNPHASVLAAQATRSGPAARTENTIRYVTADVFELTPALRPDVVISSLFAHHLGDRELVRFLGWMEASARLGWLINDLHRHPIAHGIARWAPRLLHMNQLVRHDAPVSVARSCVRRDWERLLAEAGLAGPPTAVSWRFPFRYAVGRIKAT